MIHASIFRDELVLVEVKTKVAQLKGSDQIVHNLYFKEDVEGCYVHTDENIKNNIKGLRFDVHQLLDETDYICWKFVCVYDSGLIEKKLVQAFFETVLEHTRVYRENELQWKYGKKYACQISFAPTLNRLMKTFTTCGNISSNYRGKKSLDMTASIIQSNNQLLEERRLKIQEAIRKEQRRASIREIREETVTVLRSFASKLRRRNGLVEKGGATVATKSLNESDMTENLSESEDGEEVNIPRNVVETFGTRE